MGGRVCKNINKNRVLLCTLGFTSTVYTRVKVEKFWTILGKKKFQFVVLLVVIVIKRKPELVLIHHLPTAVLLIQKQYIKPAVLNLALWVRMLDLFFQLYRVFFILAYLTCS
jgi:hypothetical protein